MGGKKATERLERAERVARDVLRRVGIDKPHEGQLASGILSVLEIWDKEGEPDFLESTKE
jgi:hypothetical protein